MSGVKQIITEHAAKKAAELDFCYLCGAPLTDGRPVNRDHVPPKKVFRTEDRNWPLILPTHNECNEKYSISDEQLKYLIALIHSDATELPPKTSIAGITYKNGNPENVRFSGLLIEDDH